MTEEKTVQRNQVKPIGTQGSRIKKRWEGEFTDGGGGKEKTFPINQTSKNLGKLVPNANCRKSQKTGPCH